MEESRRQPPLCTVLACPPTDCTTDRMDFTMVAAPTTLIQVFLSHLYLRIHRGDNRSSCLFLLSTEVRFDSEISFLGRLFLSRSVASDVVSLIFSLLDSLAFGSFRSLKFLKDAVSLDLIFSAKIVSSTFCSKKLTVDDREEDDDEAYPGDDEIFSGTTEEVVPFARCFSTITVINVFSLLFIMPVYLEAAARASDLAALKYWCFNKLLDVECGLTYMSLLDVEL
ncbi:uncharacterized protein G2W53_033131 [Senna tora]|uniref:Uncharacterized protein n=1 Tax=Senna tora TaxID=362788 RepID=A0A834SXN4_9FABA|nr:uncharacterized protein G2W53_033131 [Senna tora]